MHNVSSKLETVIRTDFPEERSASRSRHYLFLTEGCVMTVTDLIFRQEFYCWVMEMLGTPIKQINLILSKSTSLPQKSWTSSAAPEVHLKLHGRWQRELVGLMGVLSYRCWSRAECCEELCKNELSFCDRLTHPCSFPSCLFKPTPLLTCL